jgi:hypothetical protein
MVNVRLHENSSPRFETMLMPANFSSIVGEFITANLPKHSPGVVKNRYHNGHHDIPPAGRPQRLAAVLPRQSWRNNTLRTSTIPASQPGGFFCPMMLFFVESS